MALRGAVHVGRRANTSLLLLPRYLRRSSYNVSASSRHFYTPIPSTHNQIGLKNSVRAISGTKTVGPTPVISPKKVNEEESSPENWKVKMLYDGDCPLCMKEVDMLRERNKRFGTIKFVNIGSDEYNPEENQGLDYETAMGRIHAILSDGTVVTDVEAFRKLYEAVDLGWVYAITKYEPIATIADAVYRFWAKYRLQVTGRPPLEQVLEARRNKVCNDNKACKM